MAGTGVVCVSKRRGTRQWMPRLMNASWLAASIDRAGRGGNPAADTCAAVAVLGFRCGVGRIVTVIGDPSQSTRTIFVVPFADVAAAAGGTDASGATRPAAAKATAKAIGIRAQLFIEKPLPTVTARPVSGRGDPRPG